MKKFLLSFGIALAGFISFGVFLRCFPLGCDVLDYNELLKTFLFIALPLFIVSYTVLWFKEKKEINLKFLVISFFIVFVAAFIGAGFTDTGDWYNDIKPDIAPPNWVFPVVWNILYFMIAMSLYFVLLKSGNNEKKKIYFVYGLNLFLNILWSFIFFELKNSVFAFVELAFLMSSIFIMIRINWKIDKRSSYLLFPYLLWIIFAGILNLVIAFL